MKIPQSKHSQIARLYETGLSSCEIAKKYETSEGQISDILKKLRIKMRSHSEASMIAWMLGKMKTKRTLCFLPKERWKLAYFAGLIDGEGTVSKNGSGLRDRTIPYVKIANTDKKMIDWIKENFGGNMDEETSPSRKKHLKWRRCYRWITSSIDGCYLILKAVLPFLITKRVGALQVLSVCEKRLQLRREVVKKFPKIFYNVEWKKEGEK